MKRTKETVWNDHFHDGVFSSSYEERRVIYTNKKLGRHVKDMYGSHQLDSRNHYITNSKTIQSFNMVKFLEEAKAKGQSVNIRSTYE